VPWCGAEQFVLQPIAKLAPFLDIGEDLRATLFKLAQITQALFQQAQLGIEATLASLR
jgi:hypothetical protein